MADNLITETASQSAGDAEAVDLSRLVQWFEDSERATYDARRLSERDRDWYDNKQLTAQERQTLRKRKQPDTIKNRIKRKVDFLTGFEATQRTDPKAFPRNPQDTEAAEAATDMLRFQEYAGRLDQKFSDVWEEMLIEGFGGVEVLGPNPKRPEVIEVKLWHWDRLFYDPHSRAHDFSDARYVGGMVWLDLDDATARWPDAKDELEATAAHVGTGGSIGETGEDRPREIVWSTAGDRNRVRIVQIYYRDGGDWHWCLYTKGGKIDGGKIEFESGDPEAGAPLIMQSAYVDRENQRYGIVREMIGPQDEINKRSSKALHRLSVNQIVTEQGIVNNKDAVRREAARPDGFIELAPGGMERFKFRDQTASMAGELQLLQEAKQEIDLMGPNASLQGKQEGGASGRAIRASQEGGVIEMARLRDRHRDFKRRVYRAIWDRVRQFVTEQTWVRVTDQDGNAKFVGLNRPVTLGEKATKEILASGQTEDATEAATLALGAIEAQGGNAEAVAGLENVPAQMDMDILIEDATESINIQEEQFELLANLASAGVQFPPEVYIRASSLRNKDELIEAMAGDPAQAEIQNQQIALALEKIAAEIEEIKSKTVKNRADAMESLADAERKDMETDAKLSAPASGPADLQGPAGLPIGQPGQVPPTF